MDANDYGRFMRTRSEPKISFVKPRIPLHYRAKELGFTAADLKVGTPACVSIGSDSYAATVVDVRIVDGQVRAITVQRDRRHGSVYTLDPQGTLQSFTLRQDGHFRLKGSKPGSGYHLSLGWRETQLDPSF